MSDDEYNAIIEKLANKIEDDKTSLDEQDPTVLQKYYDYVKNNFNIEEEQATILVNEAFLYLKMKNAGDIDPLQQGDKFGAGFS